VAFEVRDPVCEILEARYMQGMVERTVRESWFDAARVQEGEFPVIALRDPADGWGSNEVASVVIG
jgi:hypothetical protein